MRRAHLLSFAFGVTLGSACTQGASNDPAAGALMRVANAQFVGGPTPTATGGPEVESIDLLTNSIWPGYSDKPLRGTLGPAATAATLALSDDIGYWVVRAGVADVSASTLPTFRATAAFSNDIVAGAYTLEVRAVDATGLFGPPNRQVLTALALAPSEEVTGALVVTLGWDTEADLDLHVVDPLGNEIFHGAPSSVDAFQPDASGQSIGSLDIDSNAGCNIDGLRRENVRWAKEPPSGHYLVRVDTASLCAAISAHWRVVVTVDGVALGGVAGLALDADTREAHDRGAGVLAFEFDVP